MIGVMLLGLLPFVQNGSLIENYEEAYSSEKLTLEIIGRLEGKDNRTAVETAYLGAFNMLMANHSRNPFSKMSYFQEGKEWIDAAISDDPENIEIIYLRFINQVETPRILGYKSNIEEDKDIILSGIKELKGSELHARMVKYLKGCEKLTSEEKQKIGE